MNICEYGCGREALYQLKNGKWCCSSHCNKCPIKRKKAKENRKLIPIETTELCSYGCGQIAKYKFKTGKLCCSESYNHCPVNRKKISKKSKGKLMPKPIPIETTELCSYGCGQVSKYKFKNGKLCCSEYLSSCPEISKKISKSVKGKLMPKLIPIETTDLCSYGCGQIAKYKLKNKKLCCDDSWNKCPEISKKISESLKGKLMPKSIPIETTKLCDYGCGQIAKYKLKNGKLCCCKHFNICPENRKKIKLTISQIEDRYSTFTKEESMRYNPDKPNENEIQVRCKNHNCPNSKEQDGWFTPTKSQLSRRIVCLEKPNGNDGCFFYCSDECKEECPLFNRRYDPYKEIDNDLLYIPKEYNTLRDKVFEDQRIEYNIDYNFCEMCESTKNLHLHHYKPVKTHPIMALDPTNGIILCKKCHYKIGHKTGTVCSTGYLANIDC